MRRGLRDGSRDCLVRRAAPRRGRRGIADAASALGAADVHGQRRPRADGGARLARRRPGDRVGRHHLAREGAGRARHDGRRSRDGRPRRAGQPVGAARRSWTGTRREPTREEVVAELVLFIRETVRELGERRASGFLKKFYGWYLGQRALPAAVQAGARRARLDRGGRAAADAAAPGRARADRAARGRGARAATRSRSSCRSRSTAAARTWGNPSVPPRARSFSGTPLPSIVGLPAGRAGLDGRHPHLPRPTRLRTKAIRMRAPVVAASAPRPTKIVPET